MEDGGHASGASALAGAMAVGAGVAHLVHADAGHAAHAAHAGSHGHPLAFVAAGVALVAAGLYLAATGRRRAWALAGGLSAATALAYAASRTVGLWGHPGAWDRLGLAVTAGELAVVVAAISVLTPRVRRRVLLPTLASLVALPALSASAITGDTPTGCVTPNRTMTLYAEELPPGPDGKPRLGFGTRPTNASTPGPLIEMTEGECLAVTVVNHVSAATLAALRDDPRWPGDPGQALALSLHVHGVKYRMSSDGTPHSGSTVGPGQARTYLWYAAPRVVAGGRVVSPGSAGYWWYHDHAAGTKHGTGGLQAGLFGGLVVRRQADPRPDHTYVVAMGGPAPLINFARGAQAFNCDATGNKPGPHCFVADEGERVEFLVIGVPGPVPAEDMHEFHMHGHTWADNRTGLLATPDDETRVIDAKAIGPSETFGFQVIAGSHVGPGDWMLHCHIQGHSDRGMATFFRVTGNDLGLPAAPAHSGGH